MTPCELRTTSITTDRMINFTIYTAALTKFNKARGGHVVCLDGNIPTLKVFGAVPADGGSTAYFGKTISRRTWLYLVFPIGAKQCKEGMIVPLKLGFNNRFRYH